MTQVILLYLSNENDFVTPGTNYKTVHRVSEYRSRKNLTFNINHMLENVSNVRKQEDLTRKLFTH